jgi:hypothetical protein
MRAHPTLQPPPAAKSFPDLSGAMPLYGRLRKLLRVVTFLH